MDFGRALQCAKPDEDPKTPALIAIIVCFSHTGCDRLPFQGTMGKSPGGVPRAAGTTAFSTGS